jgi:hypothetical protein
MSPRHFNGGGCAGLAEEVPGDERQVVARRHGGGVGVTSAERGHEGTVVTGDLLGLLR